MHFVDTKEPTYRVCSLERLSATLRQSDIIEFPLFDEFSKSLDRFLDRDVWIHSCGFKEVKFFETSEMFVDVVDASPQVFRTNAPYQKDREG